MGKAKRDKPLRLPEKLLQIRQHLCISQTEMLKLIGSPKKLSRVDISKYERGIREPSLLVILGYARSISMSTDVLIDDDLEIFTRKFLS